MGDCNSEDRRTCIKCGGQHPLCAFLYDKRRSTPSSTCHQCYKGRLKEWRHLHPESSKEASAAYRRENVESLTAYWKDRYQRKREEISAYWKRYREANKSLIAERKLSYKRRDPEHFRKLVRASYERRRPSLLQKAVIGTRNRRARLRNADGKHSAADVQRIYSEQGGKCATCKVALIPGYHVDHIMPIARGGSNWASNIQILCPQCNWRKNDKHPADWARENGLIA